MPMKLCVAGKAIIFDTKKRILLLKESSKYIDGTNVGRWGVPGGRLEAEETIESGLIREVMEETGLVVRKGRLLDALENFPKISGKTVHIIRLYYECSIESNEVVLSEDHDEYRWVNKDEIESLDVMDDVKEIIKK